MLHPGRYQLTQRLVREIPLLVVTFVRGCCPGVVLIHMQTTLRAQVLFSQSKIHFMF